MPGKTGSGVPHGGRGSTGGKGLTRQTGGTRGTARHRHRKVIKDAIRGITKNDIRRLARRGGVKRISAQIYDNARECLKDHLTQILGDCTIFLDSAKPERRTITVTDVIFALKRIGRPIYGFGNANFRPVYRKKTKVSRSAVSGLVRN